jgi:endonuclease/exonuclease/phosphatase (EEP) superfamily protein YafD
MFRRMLTWFAAGASAGLALLTTGGVLAPIDPRLEMINHFRPFWLLGAAMLLGLTILLRRRLLIAAACSLVLLLGGMTALPLRDGAPAANLAAPSLRIASLNLSPQNRRLDAVARYLIAEKPDVIVLQEVLCREYDPLFEALRAAYPHQFRASESCFGQAILSKHPIVTTGRRNFHWRRPSWLWAEIAFGGKTVRITGVHLSHPTRPFDQVANMDELIAYVRNIETPHAIAGDFNLTPYASLLAKFSRETGVLRHGTFHASWPSRLPFPIVLIDHVYTSAHFGSAGFRVGPFLGSDHYPVIADLVLR